MSPHNPSPHHAEATAGYAAEQGLITVRQAIGLVLSAWLGWAIPLELMPLLPAITGYATPLETAGMAAEIGGTLLLWGLLPLPGVALGAGTWRLISRRSSFAGIFSQGLNLYAAGVIGLSTARAARRWLSQWPLPESALQLVGNGMLWLVVGVLMAAMLWRRQRTTGQALMGEGIPRMAGATALALVFGWLACQISSPPLGTSHSAGATEVEQGSPVAPKRPDMVLITIDTFSAAHAGWNGYSRETTPNLDGFAQSASVFEDFYANSNFTTAGVSSLMLGNRPWTHRVFLAPARPHSSQLRDSLPAVLQAAGYRTLAVSSNPWASPEHIGLAPWFEVSKASRPWQALCPWDPANVLERLVAPRSMAVLQTLGWFIAPREWALRRLLSHGLCPPSGHFDPDDAFRQAEALIAPRALDARPVFLWIHLTPPHDPYAPPAPFVGLFDASPDARDLLNSSPRYHYQAIADSPERRLRLEARYDEALRYTDAAVGRFFDHLRHDQRFTQSAVVVTADHGESFRASYGGHGGPELFDDVIRIPLLIHLPGQSVGRRIKGPAEQVDLLPTLAELAGLSLGSGTYEGRSLQPSLEGLALEAKPVWSMTFERQGAAPGLQQGGIAMVSDRWKLHLQVGPPDPLTPQPKQYRLYDLAQDPHEARDLASTAPEVLKAMKAATERQLATHQAPLRQGAAP